MLLLEMLLYLFIFSQLILVMTTPLKILPIVLTCDNKYFNYALVTLQSIILNAKSPLIYHIHLVHVDITPEQQMIAQQLVANYDHILLDFMYLDQFDPSQFYCGINISYISVATYLRLYIPLLFPHYDRLLYLDCDIAVHLDLAQLLDIDLSDHLVAAVRDKYIDQCVLNDVANPFKIFPPEEHHLISKDYRYFDKTYYEQILGFTAPGEYFNAGVILFNLQRIRALGLSAAFLAAQQEIIEPVYRDQDILNYVVRQYGGYYHLADKFNAKYDNEDWCRIAPLQHEMYQVGSGYVHQHFPGREIAILASGVNRLPREIYHYLSSWKPWDDMHVDYGWIWWCYAATTPVFPTLMAGIKKGVFTTQIVAIFTTVAQQYLLAQNPPHSYTLPQGKATAQEIDCLARQAIAQREGTLPLQEGNVFVVPELLPPELVASAKQAKATGSSQ